MNKRDLKAYSRFDGTGRVVPGSTVLRRQKPKVGNWKEVQAYECCNVDQAPVLVTVLGSYTIYNPSIEIGADNGDSYQSVRCYGIGSVANINQLADAFNAQFSNLGYFRVVDGDLYWTPSIQIAEFYQGNNTTALYAVSFSND